jgi:hypothetical protein
MFLRDEIKNKKIPIDAAFADVPGLQEGETT